jgi:hypothetical protein
MPRACSICQHRERQSIDKELAAGGTMRELAAKYRVSPDAIERHAANHLPARLVAQQEVREQAQALDVMAELTRCFARVNLLFDACHAWLDDPNHPGTYYLGPRAEEVQIVYTEWRQQGKQCIPVRKKESLQALLDRATGTGLEVGLVESKHADPRKLVLDTAAQLTRQIELLAKLLGELQQEGTVNVVLSPEWQTIRATLLAALAPYPEAGRAVTAALVAVETA